jgi:hypothetical protein
MKELEDCLREALEESPYGIVTNDTALETARKYASELLRQRDELRDALAEQKRLYFNLFDEDVSCMYCEAKLKRGSAIILCKECAENTEV